MAQTREEKLAYDRAWRAANREKMREYARQYRINNPERYARYDKKHAARKKEWRKANPERDAANRRRENLKKNYGLTPEQVDAMFEAQGSRCAVCKDDSIRADAKARHIDHCHETGGVRAILCRPCNLALGHTKDNPETLRALADYLEHHKTKKS